MIISNTTGIEFVAMKIGIIKIYNFYHSCSYTPPISDVDTCTNHVSTIQTQYTRTLVRLLIKPITVFYSQNALQNVVNHSKTLMYVDDLEMFFYHLVIR